MPSPKHVQVGNAVLLISLQIIYQEKRRICKYNICHPKYCTLHREDRWFETGVREFLCVNVEKKSLKKRKRSTTTLASKKDCSSHTQLNSSQFNFIHQIHIDNIHDLKALQLNSKEETLHY